MSCHGNAYQLKELTANICGHFVLKKFKDTFSNLSYSQGLIKSDCFTIFLGKLHYEFSSMYNYRSDIL